MQLPVIEVDAYRAATDALRRREARYVGEDGDGGDDATGAALPASVRSECRKAADALKTFGALVVRDERNVSARDSDEFLDMLEEYFAQSTAEKMRDARPLLSYQVGFTPEFTERPRDASQYVATHLAPHGRSCGSDVGDGSANATADANDNGVGVNADENDDSGNLPRSVAHRAACSDAEYAHTDADAKERFFWRVGERPRRTNFPELNAEPVVPARFAQRWRPVMDRWGGKLLDTLFRVAEMSALGMSLERHAFTRFMRNGPHLLAPTGSDLARYGERVDTALAGFHYDLNLLTIHGKSRYPGLFLWSAAGERFAAHVPDGCLLVQAGIQMEYLTGGRVKRGYHEVVVSEATRAKARTRPAWRVSSTLFGHVASDCILQPLVRGDDSDGSSGAGTYPPIQAGVQVGDELRAIELSADTAS